MKSINLLLIACVLFASTFLVSPVHGQTRGICQRSVGESAFTSAQNGFLALSQLPEKAKVLQRLVKLDACENIAGELGMLQVTVAQYQQIQQTNDVVWRELSRTQLDVAGGSNSLSRINCNSFDLRPTLGESITNITFYRTTGGYVVGFDVHTIKITSPIEYFRIGKVGSQFQKQSLTNILNQLLGFNGYVDKRQTTFNGTSQFYDSVQVTGIVETRATCLANQSQSDPNVLVPITIAFDSLFKVPDRNANTDIPCANRENVQRKVICYLNRYSSFVQVSASIFVVFLTVQCCICCLWYQVRREAIAQNDTANEIEVDIYGNIHYKQARRNPNKDQIQSSQMIRMNYHESEESDEGSQAEGPSRQP